MIPHLKQFWHTKKTIRTFNLKNYQPYCELELKKGNLTVKTAENTGELLQALQLRHRVFHQEWLGINQLSGLDSDNFDHQCDHLIVVDNVSNKVVGTYRLNLFDLSSKLYSALEFDVFPILKLENSLLELGRACIDKDYRTGSVISLLWRGILSYMHQNECEMLLGCGSIKTFSVFDAALLFKYFREKNKLSLLSFCEAERGFKIHGLNDFIQRWDKDLTPEEIKMAEEKIPSLLNSYLRAGALISSEPALDRTFACTDFLVCLTSTDLNLNHKRRFSQNTIQQGEEYHESLFQGYSNSQNSH